VLLQSLVSVFLCSKTNVRLTVRSTKVIHQKSNAIWCQHQTREEMSNFFLGAAKWQPTYSNNDIRRVSRAIRSSTFQCHLHVLSFRLENINISTADMMFVLCESFLNVFFSFQLHISLSTSPTTSKTHKMNSIFAARYITPFKESNNFCRSR